MAKPKILKNAIRDLRRALNYRGLYEKDVADDPFIQFEKWLKEAVAKENFEPNAMTLATVSGDGAPTARTVLLKDFGPDGFVFFTNYQSRKGHNLTANPRASLVFYWGTLSRQVLIEGTVVRVDRAASEEYFHSRPRGSQVAAYVSNQSRPVEDREELESRVKEVNQQFKGAAIPCPEHWGGYRVIPSRIEFWQGRPDRLHDRICFSRGEDKSWSRVRLAP